MYVIKVFKTVQRHLDKLRIGLALLGICLKTTQKHFEDIYAHSDVIAVLIIPGRI